MNEKYLSQSSPKSMKIKAHYTDAIVFLIETKTVSSNHYYESEVRLAIGKESVSNSCYKSIAKQTKYSSALDI